MRPGTTVPPRASRTSAGSAGASSPTATTTPSAMWTLTSRNAEEWPSKTAPLTIERLIARRWYVRQFRAVGRSFDAVVVGAGVVGAACAYFLARDGLAVAV